MRIKNTLWLILPLVLSACASKFDLSNSNHYGLRCSADANSAPDWQACHDNAQRVCAPLSAVHITQHAPTGSGSPDDAYFINFSCGQTSDIAPATPQP